ncbi:hypothetical protein ETAA8_52310 [Anatilimnocola aggregata]|uniref:Exo-alpha-sialidase n=1 Tax=Anatilimnocola aggregata TaxID=2528021 RepID=A0A517YIS2_9BACT|nr:exo-alpha-sialidase [Anatilimnocola aggregata]QDU30112.1 hypothetical protein ETAA8_52310 [Anatilimnocola aggregata]
MNEHSAKPGKGKLLWLAMAAVAVVAAIAVGYFLPPADRVPPLESQTDQTSVVVPAETGPWKDAVRHSFPLAAADIRDSQEAPVVAVDAQQRIYLAWSSQTGSDERTLFLMTSVDRGQTFASPRAFRKSGIFKSVSQMKGKTVARERRMLPQLAAYGDKVVIGWGDAPADGQSIQLLVAETSDGGVTFSEPVTAHESADARPTFISMSVSPSGKVACSWLDSRNRAQQPFAAVRFAGSDTFGAEQLIFAGQDDKGVCPCCTTVVKVADDETVVVAYRGQVDGYRDIWISVKRPSDTQFSQPVPVVSPTWEFAGCPHDGPSLAITGDVLHAAWMDARTGQQRCYYGWANLHDLKFTTQELHSAGPGTQGNARLWTDGSGAVHAIWEESLADEPVAKIGEPAEHQHGPPTGAGRVVMHSIAPRADGKFDLPHPLASRPGKFQTRPGIASGTSGLLVAAWNELDETGKRVMVAVRNTSAVANEPVAQVNADSQDGK